MNKNNPIKVIYDKYNIAFKDYIRGEVRETLRYLSIDQGRNREECKRRISRMYQILEEEGFKNIKGRRGCNHDMKEWDSYALNIKIGEFKRCKKCGWQKFRAMTMRELFNEFIMEDIREEYRRDKCVK